MSVLMGGIWIAAVAAIAEPEQETTFRFAPPDATTYVKAVKSTKAITQGDLTRTDVEEMRIRGNIRKTEKGYTLTEEIASIKSFRNGEPVELQFPASAFVGFRAQLDLNDRGKVVGTRGRDELLSRLKNDPKNTTPDDVAKTIANAAFAAVEAEWNANIVSLAGRAVKIGNSFASTSEAILPLGAAATVTSETRLIEKLNHKGNDCIRVRVNYNSKENALLRAQQKLLDEMSKGDPGQSIRVLKADVVGQEERVIDPSTMLVYSETYDRTSNVVIEGPNTGKLTRSLKHQKEATYEYGK